MMYHCTTQPFKEHLGQADLFMLTLSPRVVTAWCLSSSVVLLRHTLRPSDINVILPRRIRCPNVDSRVFNQIYPTCSDWLLNPDNHYSIRASLSWHFSGVSELLMSRLWLLRSHTGWKKMTLLQMNHRAV
jgi:hypothetical protein